MSKTGFLINLIYLFALCKTGFAQCDTFAMDILRIIKTESNADLNNYLLNPEETTKLLHWEADSTSYLLLKEINYSILQSIIENIQNFRDTLISKGLDINTIQYQDCGFKNNLSSEIKIGFTIEEVYDSLEVVVLALPKLYIIQELNYHFEKKNTLIEEHSDLMDIVNTNNNLFNPGNDELALGINLLQDYLKINSIEYHNFRFVLAYQDESNHTILRYIVFMSDDEIKLLDLDLERKIWEELISK